MALSYMLDLVCVNMAFKLRMCAKLGSLKHCLSKALQTFVWQVVWHAQLTSDSVLISIWTL